jgi:hypothetical protein
VIGGASFEIAPDAELFVDYRYRDAAAKETSITPAFGPVLSHSISENVVMAGVRFYMFPAAPAVEEPPPPAYTPPPAYASPPAYSPPAEQAPAQTMPPAPNTSGGATSSGAGSSGPQ